MNWLIIVPTVTIACAIIAFPIAAWLDMRRVFRPRKSRPYEERRREHAIRRAILLKIGRTME